MDLERKVSPTVRLARCAILDSSNRVLLLRQANIWKLPGSQLAQSENIYSGLRRMVFEETRLTMLGSLRLILRENIRFKDGQNLGLKYKLRVGLTQEIKGQLQLGEGYDGFDWLSWPDIINIPTEVEVTSALLALESRKII